MRRLAFVKWVIALSVYGILFGACNKENADLNNPANTPACPADPMLDITFGNCGKVTTDFGNSADIGHAIAIQSDGKIVVAGYVYNGSNHDFALARYNTDGTLDLSFGNGGKVTTDFGGSSGVGRAIAIQSDGKIVVAGTSGGNFALARYNSDGSLDTSFGTGGKVTTDFFSSDDGGYAIAIQSDGKIVVAGGSDGNFALARYNTDGILDTSFGKTGKVTTDILGADHGKAVAIQSDGKIVVAGDNKSDFTLVRYNPNGTLDTTFGKTGKVITDFGGSDDQGNAVAIQKDGKIVVAGQSSNGSNTDFALARYKSQ